MRGTYHLCLSSHEEVMFRSVQDQNMAFNCFALAVLETESRALADGIMSTHEHFGVQSDYPEELMRRIRYAYSRFFNSKYHRKGRLGEKHAFISRTEGLMHTTHMLNYTLRQGLHHGLTETAFGYEQSSINTIFRKELGKPQRDQNQYLSDKHKSKYLPEGVHIGPSYRMDKSGLLLREDIIDVAYVEEIYITPKNFLFQMSRLSDDKIISEQLAENKDIPVITLESIEKGVSDTVKAQMYSNERGRVDYSRMTDLELCSLIDNVIVPDFYDSIDYNTIYDIKQSKRIDLANSLYLKYRIPGQNIMAIPFDRINKMVSLPQLKRCMAL